jgi:hypothetical protein
MTILERCEQWKDEGAISPGQYAHCVGLIRKERFSLFLELNVLLYAGVLAFVAGLGWTIATWSRQLGDVAVVVSLSLLLLACFAYTFRRAPAWSPKQVASPSLLFDYVLYLGSLVWCVELTYLEQRFHLLSRQWDLSLLITAFFFFFLAYRLDNRFVLSLALSSLAGWFGVTLSHWASLSAASYRPYALLYCLLIAGGGALLRHRRLKAHFFDTYLNLATNIFFWAVLSGVIGRQSNSLWAVVLLVACGAALACGVTQRRFAFVAYAAVYGYAGVSWLLLRNVNNATLVLGYFVITAILMVALLIAIARRFGRAA